MPGYQVSHLQDGGQNTRIKNTPILKSVTLPMNFSGTSSQEFVPNFSLRQFDVISIAKDCMCVT